MAIILLLTGNVRTMVDAPSQPLRSRDHLVEQLLPYNHWTNNYYAPTSPLRENIRDVFLVVPKVNTTVRFRNINSTLL